MEPQNLYMICASAFISVFGLLTFLALVMRLLIALFPERQSGADPTVFAALATAVGLVYPGTKISKIEEKR